MADQVDAPVHSMKAPRLEAVPNSAAAEASFSKLVQRHNSSLLRCERRNHLVGMCLVVIYTLSVHITTKACVTSARQWLSRRCRAGVVIRYALAVAGG